MRRLLGYSLMETLMAMTLVLIVLGSAAAIVYDLSNATRFSAGKSATLLAAQVGLDRMRGEVRQAYSIATPSGTIASSDLVFSKVNADTSTSTRMQPSGGIWYPYAPNSTTIHYYLSGQTLLRSSNDGSTTVACSLATAISSLSCQLQTDGTLQITVTTQEQNGARSLVMRVFLPIQVPSGWNG